MLLTDGAPDQGRGFAHGHAVQQVLVHTNNHYVNESFDIYLTRQVVWPKTNCIVLVPARPRTSVGAGICQCPALGSGASAGSGAGAGPSAEKARTTLSVSALPRVPGVWSRLDTGTATR